MKTVLSFDKRCDEDFRYPSTLDNGIQILMSERLMPSDVRGTFIDGHYDVEASQVSCGF